MSKRQFFGWVSLPGSALRAVPQVREIEAKRFTLPGWRVREIVLRPGVCMVEMETTG